jgi:hypothetical protein
MAVPVDAEDILGSPFNHAASNGMGASLRATTLTHNIHMVILRTNKTDSAQ